MGVLSRKPARVRRQAMPVASSIAWKPLRDSHYIIASLQPGGGGIRQVFVRQSTLREVQGLVRRDREQPVVGLLLGERLDCALSMTPYLLIDSHVDVAIGSLDERTVADAIRTLHERLGRLKSVEVLGWFCTSRTADPAVSRAQAAVHATWFAEPWKTVLVFGEGGDNGAFHLHDPSAARWFQSPFYEVTDSKATHRGPKPTCVAWPAYITTASVVPIAVAPQEVTPAPTRVFVTRPAVPQAREEPVAPRRPVVTTTRTPTREAIDGVGRAAVAARRSAVDLANLVRGHAVTATRNATERLVEIRAEWDSRAAQRKAEADAARARDEERRAKEAAKRRAEREEAERRAAEEEKRRAAEAEARRAAEAEARRKAAEEAERRRAAEAEARRQAAEARRKAEEAEALRRAEEAEARRLAEAKAAEARRIAEAEAEAARRIAEAKAEEARRIAEAEAAEARRIAEAEAQRKAAEEAQRRAAEAEARRKAAEEAQRIAAEEERRRAAEAEARRRAAEAEAEARRQAAEAEARRQAAEAEEKARRAAAEAEARRVAEAEEKARREAAEAEARRLAEVEEKARREAAEAEARRFAEAEAQRAAREAEARRLAEEAEARRLAEETRTRRLAEEAEARRLAEEAETRRLEKEAEARRRAEEAEADARRRAEEAEARRLEEEKAAEARRIAEREEATRIAVAEAEAEARRKAAEAAEETRRKAAEAEEEARRKVVEAEEEARRKAAEAEEEARAKAAESEEDARRRAAEAEALRISVEVAATRARLARPPAPLEGSRRETPKSAAALAADAEDTTAGDGPYRYLALARREGFEVSQKMERGNPEQPETVWLLHESESGLRLIVVTTDAEVREASLHYNLRTADDALLRVTAPEHRDLATRTIYGREACLHDLRARCRRLRATGALEPDWKVSPTFQTAAPPRERIAR
jgi:hypothetical protein